jgi:hypothetical protein
VTTGLVDGAMDLPLPRESANRRFGVVIAVLAMVVVAVLGAAAGQPLTRFTGAYWAVALVPLWNTRSDTRDVFRPYYCIVALLFLYAVATPLFVREVGTTYFGEAVDPQDITTYYIACLAAVGGVAAGTLVASYSRIRRRRVVDARTRENERRALFIATVIVGVLTAPFFLKKFDPAAAVSYADEALALRVRRMADTSAGLTETFLETMPAMLVLASTCLLVFRSRQTIWRAVGIGAIALYAFTSFLSGFRGDLVAALLIVGTYVHYRVRAFRWREVAFGSIALYVLVNGIALVRATSDPRQMLVFLRTEVASRGFQFLSLGHSGELITSSNLLRLISGIRGGESDFGLGAVLVSQFGAFVPRSILPDRPDMASEHFVKVFYPGVFESGGGYGFFMVQDGYWDFGIFGAFAYCALYAFLLERLYRTIRAHFDSDLMVFLYALLYSQLALFVARSGLVAATKAALIAALPILVPFWLSRVVPAVRAARANRSTIAPSSS